ncbi:MAG: glycosyltransferase family 2 protein [Bacilli bacterium]|jgi:N-acetylglucosaminyl-diphospho-decaprenol L-rhamnosyltransferase|nr:glycosyltransferase family 2 protein [Bacilli bacterium]
MIGFLIINYNDALTTKKLLNNIKEYSCLQYIVVVDNGSTDHSFEELKTYQSDKIHIIRREGRNFGAGINYGVNYLANLGISYTFISNSDVEIKTEQDLQQIISYREKGTILAPVIREHSGLNRGWKVPTNTQLVLQSIPVFYRLFAHFNHYPNSYYSKDLIPVEVVSFCFFFISVAKFQKVGGCDEDVFLYFEENIMSRKLDMQGIYLCNQVSVFHNHSVTINKNLNRERKYRTLSQSRRYFAKYYNRANWLIRFILWILEKISILIIRVVSFFSFS